MEYDYSGNSPINPYQDTNADGVPDQPSTGLMQARTTTEYDNQGRQFRSTKWGVVWGVISATGLKTETWYDRRGNIVKTLAPQAPINKMVYDGAGRVVKSYKTTGGGDTTWADAFNVLDDLVITQTEFTLDGAGNVLLQHQRDRFHTASTTSTGTGELLDRTSTTRPSRSQYTAMYYDAANRMTDSVNVGTNAGNVYTRPSTVPARSDTALVNTLVYDSAGRAYRTIDPKGIIQQKSFDLLGRTSKTIDNYIDGVVGSADDVAVDFAYNGNNDRTVVRAFLVGGGFETTNFVFGAGTARGDTINDNRMLIATLQPTRPPAWPATPSSRRRPTTRWGRRYPTPTKISPPTR